jgi:hypothetical protein
VLVFIEIKFEEKKSKASIFFNFKGKTYDACNNIYNLNSRLSLLLFQTAFYSLSLDESSDKPKKKDVFLYF